MEHPYPHKQNNINNFISYKSTQKKRLTQSYETIEKLKERLTQSDQFNAQLSKIKAKLNNRPIHYPTK